jgi:AAA domain/DnaB-like helicase N terminal domain
MAQARCMSMRRSATDEDAYLDGGVPALYENGDAAPLENGKESPIVSRTTLAAEEAVIGALLTGGAWSEIADLMCVEDYSPVHRLILLAIEQLAREGEPHDAVTVAQELESRGHLVAAGGLACLSALSRNTPTAAHVRAYARAVRKSALMQRLPERIRDDAAIARLKHDLAELESIDTAQGTEHYPIERLDCMTAEPRTALVQGLGLDRGAVCAVIGAPNAGKTAFVVSICVHLAADCREWLGLKLTPGPILYVGAEAPASVKFRARAAVAHLARRDQVAFYVTSAVPGLGHEATSELATQHIVATIRRIQELEDRCLAIVVIDTLASCLGGGNENAEGMVLLTNAAKKIAAASGACVILVHHPAKGDNSGSARGHGSLAAACDSILLVEAESESGGEARTATLVKARDYATGSRLRFALRAVTLPDRDSFGDPLTTVVVEAATGLPVPVRRRPSGTNQDKLLCDLERQYRTGKTCFTEAEVLHAAKTLGIGDRNRNAPRNTLKSLIAGGFLAGSATGHTLKFPPEVGP